MPTIPALEAEALASSVGVVCRFHFGTSAYAETDRALALIQDLGVRKVRCRISKAESSRRGLTGLAQVGVKVNGVCGASGRPQTMAEAIATAMTYPDPRALFTSFENWNEPNNDGIPWIQATRANARDLFLARNAAGLEDVPILGPALARVDSGGVEGATTAEQSANLGDLTQYIDYGNIHVYPRGVQPGNDIDKFSVFQRSVCRSKPIVCTEAGYFQAPNYVGGARPTPEYAAAKYMPRHVMEYWSRGAAGMFVYELLGDYDPTDANQLANFGIVSVDGAGAGAPWRVKAQFLALKNFLSILGDPGGVHSVGGLAMEVSGPPDLKKSLVSKRDGSRYLILWRDVLCYDPFTKLQTATTEAKVKVTLGSMRTVRAYWPTQSALPLRTLGPVTSFQIPVSDEVVICRIE